MNYKMFVLLAAVLMGGCAKDEPTFQGKSYSQWVRQSQDLDEATSGKALAAMEKFLDYDRGGVLQVWRSHRRSEIAEQKLWQFGTASDRKVIEETLREEIRRGVGPIYLVEEINSLSPRPTALASDLRSLVARGSDADGFTLGLMDRRVLLECAENLEKK